MRRILEEAGAPIIRKAAVRYLEERLSEYASDIARKAVLVMKKEGRKTLYKEDLKLALRLSE